MKIQLITLIFCCFSAIVGFAQNAETNNSTRKITLTTGEIYFGEILVENEQIIMIRTSDGSRYQFPRSEVKSIETDFVITTGRHSERKPVPAPETTENDEKIIMLIDVHGGISSARHAFSHAPMAQGALVIGAKDVIFPNIFLGGGIGYSILFPNDYSEGGTIDFLPVFARFQTFIGSGWLVPYFEIDVGYGFSLNSDFGGGAMLKLSVGLAQKINHQSAFYFGVFSGLQNFSGRLTETNEFGTFNYHGNSTMQNLGAKIALKF